LICTSRNLPTCRSPVASSSSPPRRCLLLPLRPAPKGQTHDIASRTRKAQIGTALGNDVELGNCFSLLKSHCFLSRLRVSHEHPYFYLMGGIKGWRWVVVRSRFLRAALVILDTRSKKVALFSALSSSCPPFSDFLHVATKSSASTQNKSITLVSLNCAYRSVRSNVLGSPFLRLDMRPCAWLCE
jgi:hypothetical protein